MRQILTGLVALFWVAGAQAAPNCQVPNIRILDNQTRGGRGISKVGSLASLLGGLLLIALVVQSAEACSVPWIRWTPNAQGTMTVQSGKPCKIYFRSLGPTYETRIIKRPSHGSISWGEVQTLIYRSRPGYVGGDKFIYERVGRNAYNKPRRSKIEIVVTVNP